MVNASNTLEQRLTQAHGVSVGDLNGDGHQDVLLNILNDSEGRADQVLFGNGQGRLSANWQLFPDSVQQDGKFAAGHTWSYIGDLNADGLADMVLDTWDGGGGDGPSRVLLNQGNTRFTEAGVRELPRSGLDQEIVLAIETMDLNGDALPDLVMSITNGDPSRSSIRFPICSSWSMKGMETSATKRRSVCPKKRICEQVSGTSSSTSWTLMAMAMTPFWLRPTGTAIHAALQRNSREDLRALAVHSMIRNHVERKTACRQL